MTQWREILQGAAAQGGPILIYGPTASGKSELALRLAEALGGVIVNADASQVWANWQVVTARPGAADLARAPHGLYGHLPFDAPYSAGHWLREISPYLAAEPRPIIVGGTGLYFKALTEGLVEIPQIPDDIRRAGDALRLEGGPGALAVDLDAATKARIDLANPMRVQRAWEVLRHTGRGLAEWQDDTPAPLLPLEQALPVHVIAPKDWLNPRITARFDMMLAEGALDEARANAPHIASGFLSMKAIGARELIQAHNGALSLEDARRLAIIATEQYAKRQRTWGRARMSQWRPWDPTGDAPFW